MHLPPLHNFPDRIQTKHMRLLEIYDGHTKDMDGFSLVSFGCGPGRGMVLFGVRRMYTCFAGLFTWARCRLFGSSLLSYP